MSYTSKTWADAAGHAYTVVYHKTEFHYKDEFPIAVRAYHETINMGQYYAHSLTKDLKELKDPADFDDTEWEIPSEFAAEREERQEDIEWEMGDRLDDVEVAADILSSIVNAASSKYLLIAQNGIVDWDAVNKLHLTDIYPELETLK